MPKYLLALIVSLCLLPMIASAAWNDLQFNADTNVHVPGPDITLVVSSGSKVESLTVYSGYIVVAGAYVDATNRSSITFTSAQRQILSNNWGLETTCGATTSNLTVTWSATSPASITITPLGSCPVGAGGAPPPPPPVMPTTTTGEVTATSAAGGKTTLTTVEGTKATVELPAAAVTTDTLVKVASVSPAIVSATAPAPPGKTLVSVFDLTATAAGVAVTSFAKTITLTFTYTDAQITGLDEATLKIYRWDGTQWVILPTIVYPAINTLTATTTVFSYFAIIGEPPVVVPPVAPPVKPITEMTIEELKAEIARIIALIVQLQAELAKLIAVPRLFTTDLYYGLRADAEVKRLQEFLISKGYLASGFNTGNYLSLTVAAVKAYQQAKGITPVNGRCGPKTRAAINADLGISQ